MPLMGSSVCMVQLSKELLYLNVGPQKLLRMKNQDKSLEHRKIRKKQELWYSIN